MKTLISILIISVFLLGCKNRTENQTESKTEQEDVIIAEDGKVFDMHTSEISLDWSGTYSGVIPCADCEGIKTEVTLNNNSTFVHKSVYLGKDDTVFEESGSFRWTEDGSTVVLMKDDATTLFYKVGENHLRQLDVNGRPIEGELSESYVLRKD